MNRLFVRSPILAVAVITALAACGSTESRSLPEPSFAKVGVFSAERYLRDDQIAKSVLDGEGRALANQLLGIRPKATVAAVAPRRAVRRRVVREVEDFGEDVWPEEVSSGLSDHAFQDAIHSWRGIRQCVAAATKRAKERSGAIRVSFRIRGDGEVAESKIIDTSNAIAQAVAPCVERRARRIRFPAFGGEEDVTKVAKFVF